MIKFCVLLAAILVLVSSTPKSGISRADDLVLAEACDASACSLPDCRCMSTDIPGGLDISEIPQVLILVNILSQIYVLYIFVKGYLMCGYSWIFQTKIPSFIDFLIRVFLNLSFYVKNR